VSLGVALLPLPGALQPNQFDHKAFHDIAFTLELSWILNIQMVFPLHFQLDGSDCYRDIVVRAVTDREPARLQSENYP